VSEKDFIASLSASRFKEKIDDPNVKEKLRVLNCLIVVYKDTKKDYMFSEDEKGLTSFFKRNKDNLTGIFDTCLDRLFSDNDTCDVSKIISKNPAMNNYWLNPSIFYYIQTMEILFASGKYARSMFLNYITEGNEVGEDGENLNKPKKGKYAQREAFLCLLMKLNSDLMFF